MRSLIEDSKKIVDMIQIRVKYLRDCFPQRLETLQNLVPEDGKFPNFIKEMETNK